MLKKRLYTSLSILFCCFAITGVRAQVTVTIPAINITGQTDYNYIGDNGSFAGLILAGSIMVKSTTSNFPATTPGTLVPLALSVVNPKVNTISGSLNILGNPTEVVLSTTSQSIYSTLLGLGSGPLTVNYRIGIAGTAWLAGTYSTPLTFSNVNPTTQQLSIVVPAILTLNTQPATPTTMTVNALSAFRTGGGVSATNTFDYYSTMPTDISLKATSSTFSFSTTQLFNSTPAVTSDKLSSLLSGSYAGSAISLSTLNQAISTLTSVPVIVTNKNAFSNTLSITPENLKSNFAQAGTYTLPIVYTVEKKTSAYPATPTSITMNSSVQVTVAKMFEINMPASTVNLNFNSAAAYSQGLMATIPNPLTISSTVPYSVTVKASGDFISGENSISAGVVTVEGTATQTGITPVQLSATPVNLLTSANPEIDRVINLRFRIPSTQTANLLAKPAATYTTTVLFTIVAP
ncbi:MAG TPA: hypothetical protein VGC08_02630 [Pedobacter sp.]